MINKNTKLFWYMPDEQVQDVLADSLNSVVSEFFPDLQVIQVVKSSMSKSTYAFLYQRKHNKLTYIRFSDHDLVRKNTISLDKNFTQSKVEKAIRSLLSSKGKGSFGSNYLKLSKDYVEWLQKVVVYKTLAYHRKHSDKWLDTDTGQVTNKREFGFIKSSISFNILQTRLDESNNNIELAQFNKLNPLTDFLISLYDLETPVLPENHGLLTVYADVGVIVSDVYSSARKMKQLKIGSKISIVDLVSNTYATGIVSNIKLVSKETAKQDCGQFAVAEIKDNSEVVDELHS